MYVELARVELAFLGNDFGMSKRGCHAWFWKKKDRC